MAVGATITKTTVDNSSSNVLLDLDRAFDHIASFKLWLDSVTDPTLTALGYDSTDIANLRSAFGDADQLRTLYLGTATLGTAKDFRTFSKRIWGFGFR